jgi:TrmH family RNA methyltransferase
MLNKNNIKFIKSLSEKKNRENYKLFIAEGDKIVSEAIKNKFSIKIIFASKEWLIKNEGQISTSEIIEVTENELRKISTLKTPNKVLAVIEKPENIFNIVSLKNKLTIVLEDIQDPGNLGTIIRTADWFGIENIICSKNSVDVYNSKVVQASMGAILKVKVWYFDIIDILHENSDKIPVYGMYLEGENIFKTQLLEKGIIIFGNESKGISEKLGKLIKKRLTIPDNNSQKQIESLNVSMAVSITCAEFIRQQNYSK